MQPWQREPHYCRHRTIAVHRVDPDLSVIARGLNCFNRYKPKTGKEKAVCLKRRKNLAKIGTKYKSSLHSQLPDLKTFLYVIVFIFLG